MKLHALPRQSRRAFAVAGYVQNLDDGRVLLVAEGEEAELNRFLAKLQSVMGQYVKSQTLAKSVATGEYGEPEAGALTIKRW